jgi:hypothetical protein
MHTSTIHRCIIKTYIPSGGLKNPKTYIPSGGEVLAVAAPGGVKLDKPVDIQYMNSTYTGYIHSTYT